jgi:hypothetical protein
MKPATFSSYVVLALVLTATCLRAQSNAQASPKVMVDVPFDFMIERVMFPAGHYTIKPLANHKFRLQADRGRASVRIATKPIRSASATAATSLVFYKENGHYQLHELWMNSTGTLVPESQAGQLGNVRESRVEVPAICVDCN